MVICHRCGENGDDCPDIHLCADCYRVVFRREWRPLYKTSISAHKKPSRNLWGIYDVCMIVFIICGLWVGVVILIMGMLLD